MLALKPHPCLSKVVEDYNGYGMRSSFVNSEKEKYSVALNLRSSYVLSSFTLNFALFMKD